MTPGKFDNPSDLESVEVKVRSHDGVMVPLSIVYRKGTKLDGSNPLLLEGYGAYGTTMDPFFDKRTHVVDRYFGRDAAEGVAEHLEYEGKRWMTS